MVRSRAGRSLGSYMNWLLFKTTHEGYELIGSQPFLWIYDIPEDQKIFKYADYNLKIISFKTFTRNYVHNDKITWFVEANIDAN